MTDIHDSIGRQYGSELYRLLGEERILDEWVAQENNIRFARVRKVASRGCVPCSSFEREDKKPSAAIFVRGEKAGLYVDKGGSGYRAYLFQHAAMLHFGGDLKRARDYFGDKVGLSFEQFKAASPASTSGVQYRHKKSRQSGVESDKCRDDIGDPSEPYYDKIGQAHVPLPTQYDRYCSGKRGVTKRALQSCGVVQTAYHKRCWNPQVVFALGTFRGPELWDSGQTGAHLFNSYPGVPITLFEDKDDRREEKVILVGPAGLFGDRGLRTLKRASTVWIAEGHSDTLAAEETLLAAIDGDPTFENHVVIGVPGCETSPLECWMKHFAGKTVYVCFDVGDKDDAGQNGAKRWCNALEKAGVTVWNVVLPLGAAGKNDLRDWIVKGKKSYADMLALDKYRPPFELAERRSRATPLDSEPPARSAPLTADFEFGATPASDEIAQAPNSPTPAGSEDEARVIVSEKRINADMPVDAVNVLEADQHSAVKSEGASEASSISTSATAQLVISPEQAILDRLRCVVCGLNEEGQIEIYSTKQRATYTIRSINSFTYFNVCESLDGTIVDAVVSTEKEPAAGKVSLFDVKRAIATVAGRRRIRAGDTIGTGIWEVNDDIVFVGKQTAHRYDVSRQLTTIDSPRHYEGGKVIDFNGDIEWYKEDQLRDLLRDAADPKWRKVVVDELLDLFGTWDNWILPSSIEISAGLILATWIQTLWKFRPLVSVSGPTGSGKTKLLGEVLRGIFGEMLMAIQKTTEAGLRQEVGRTAMTVALDEFEADRNRQQTYNLLRTSSNGGKTTRGTTSGKVQKFGLKHIVWTGAIETGMDDEADRNRFILLKLNPVDHSMPSRKPFLIPSESDLRKLGMRAMAVAVHSARAARVMAESIHRSISMPGVDSRYIECFAVPAAMLAINLNLDVQSAAHTVKSWVTERDIRNQKITNEDALLEAIRTAKIRVGSRDFTVRNLAERCCNDAADSVSPYALNTDNFISADDARQALDAHGLRYVKHGGIAMFHLHGKAITTQLLYNTKHKESSINEVLERYDGGYSNLQKKTKWGVFLPTTILTQCVSLGN